MERITSLNLLGMMRRQHALSHAPSLLPRATSTITGDFFIILGDSKPFDTLDDLGSCVNLIPINLFTKLKIRLLEETHHVFGLADGTKSYPVGIVKNVEIHIGKLKLLEDCYVIDMEKDPTTPLLAGRGFLATANAVIDCRKAKIALGEGITRSIFGVKEIDLGDEDVPYLTTLGKHESYEPRPSTDGIGTPPLTMLRKTSWITICLENEKVLGMPNLTPLRMS
ncbi:retrotransposon protein, putative, ty3-gypsy subclass [Tanacetum coccineum]